jgi:hypothetical protein
VKFSFAYEYDFGDGWKHEVLFEGCLRPETGTQYPLYVEGEQVCPPEDVGGTEGYRHTCRPWPILRTKGTRSTWGGVGHMIPKRSMPRRRPPL